MAADCTAYTASDEASKPCADASDDSERLEHLREQKSQLSWRIGKQKSAGHDASALIERARELKAEIERLEAVEEQKADQDIQAEQHADDEAERIPYGAARPKAPTAVGDASLKAAIVDGSDWSEWDEKLRANAGSVFNSSVWAEYRRARGDQPCFRISLVDDGAVVKPLALATLSTGRISRRLRVRGGIEAETPQQFAGAEQLLLEIAREEGCVTVQVDGRDLPSEQSATPFGFDGPQPVEIRVRCDRSVDELWEALHTDKRRNVRRARDNGITVADESSLEAARLAARFDAELGKDRADDGEHYSGLHQDQYDALWQCLGPSGGVRFFVARIEGEPIGAALLLTWGARAYCWRVGYTGEGRDLGASPALTWARIRHACEAGFDEICLGSQHLGAEDASSPHHGLYRYKIRWDGYPVRRSSGRVVLRPIVNTLSDALDRTRRRLKALIGS